MIDTTGMPFQKPSHAEKKVTISVLRRRELLDGFCLTQGGKCCSCGRQMTREQGLMQTATLGHRNPQPMGCKKRDNPDNIIGAQCFRCNSERGSKRD